MKKPKKHTFRHVDPEMVATEPKNQTKISKQRPELPYAEKDLRRIGLLIA
jgi:hypothetical protein